MKHLTTVTLQNDQRSTRSQVSPPAPTKSYNVDIYRKSCAICGHLKHKSFGFLKKKEQKSFLRLLFSFKMKFMSGPVICRVFILFWGQIYFVTKNVSKLPSKV